jgi:hypothetical protein
MIYTTISMLASAKHSPVYLAPTFRGLSMQSFFLCVIAPQFSQAPFLYFTAREVYRKEKTNPQHSSI